MTVLSVEIEDITTWPKDFFSLVTKKKDLIVSYHNEEKNIDSHAEKNVLLRCKRPINTHKNDYMSLVSNLDGILNNHQLVGYHCTRLTPEEIKNIRISGLKVLTKELVESRLSNALSNGHLPETGYSYLQKSDLLKNSLANKNGTRTEMLWFCPNKSKLQEHHAVFRLFRSWGGEAVYNGHEEDKNISSVLRSIGSPCLVKCTIPFNDVEHFHQNFSEYFLSFSVKQEINCPHPGYQFDMHIKRDIPSSEVLEIIEFSNPRFKELTDHSSWPKCYQVG